MSPRHNTYPGGIPDLVPLYQKRRSKLTHHDGEELPPLEVDFKPLTQQKLPPQPKRRPEGLSRVAKKRHMLLGELQGLSELEMLHGMLISHLRKHTYPDHAPELFRRLWAEEEDWLLDHLPPRWLISAVITFAEHGETEEDRHLAQSFNILFSVMKIYEFERTYAGLPPQHPFPAGGRAKAPLPLGMRDFALVGGDLEAALLAPLWRQSRQAPAIRRLAQALLMMLDQDDGTVFRRLALMRDTK